MNINFKQNKIMAKKALLMILDGWGCGDHQKDDVIFQHSDSVLGQPVGYISAFSTSGKR